MNDDLRDFASGMNQIANWLFIVGVIWFAGFGILVAAVILRL